MAMKKKEDIQQEQEVQPERSENRKSARQRIFETASDLFYRKGIRAVGVETIAQEANTTKMSLYRHFASKDELVAEWLRQYVASFWQYWEEMVKQYPNDPRRQLGAFFQTIAEHASDPDSRGCAAANAAVELTDPDHPARKVIQEHKWRLRARLVQMCTEMKAGDPEGLADGLFLLIEGAQGSTQSLGSSGPGCSVARAAETFIDAHLRKTSTTF
jgi:AcrR family transcriptional regulator